MNFGINADFDSEPDIAVLSKGIRAGFDELLALEVGSKTAKHHQMRITMARFPFQKTLESFDFKFQPSIDVKLLRELAGGRYMDSGDNVLFLGPPGVGKTHLAVALGIKACEQGVRTLFISATALITTLGRAFAEGRPLRAPAMGH